MWHAQHTSGGSTRERLRDAGAATSALGCFPLAACLWCRDDVRAITDKVHAHARLRYIYTRAPKKKTKEGRKHHAGVIVRVRQGPGRRTHLVMAASGVAARLAILATGGGKSHLVGLECWRERSTHRALNGEPQGARAGRGAAKGQG